MSECPVDGFPAPAFVASNGVVEGELEAALGRIWDGLDAGFKVGPADGLALAIELKAVQKARSEDGGILSAGGEGEGEEQDRRDGKRQGIV